MLNTELMRRYGSQLNDFTRALRDLCLEKGTVLVKMRNGSWSEVLYVPAEVDQHPYDDCPDGGFRSPDHTRYWNANGTSITGDKFDLISFDAPEKPVTMELTDKDRELLAMAVAEALCDAYDCTRTWSAWGVGTMSQDDFSLVAEDPDRVSDLVDAMLAALARTGKTLVDSKVHAHANKLLAMVHELDEYLREIRAENLAGSEPQLGVLLEQSLTLRLAVEAAGLPADAVLTSPRAWVYEGDNPGFITDPVFAAKWKGPVPLSPLFKGVPPDAIEHIAAQWDGCLYEDAIGCELDIGQSIRQAYRNLMSRQ